MRKNKKDENLDLRDDDENSLFKEKNKTKKSKLSRFLDSFRSNEDCSEKKNDAETNSISSRNGLLKRLFFTKSAQRSEIRKRHENVVESNENQNGINNKIMSEIDFNPGNIGAINLVSV